MSDFYTKEYRKALLEKKKYFNKHPEEAKRAARATYKKQNDEYNRGMNWKKEP